MRKQAGGLLLACVLLLAALPNAQAADIPTPTPNTQEIWGAAPGASPVPVPTPAYSDYTGGSTGQEIEITGRIKPHIISAIVTCQVDFQMNPGESQDIGLGDGNDLTLTELLSPETATVTNTSTISIQVSVAEVKVENFKIGEELPQNGEALLLTNEIAKTADPYTVLLVLGTADDTFADLDAFQAQALTMDTKDLTIIKSLPPAAEPQTDPPANVKHLQIYGKTADAVETPYSFTVITTLRIAPASNADGGP